MINSPRHSLGIVPYDADDLVSLSAGQSSKVSRDFAAASEDQKLAHRSIRAACRLIRCVEMFGEKNCVTCVISM
jgi:hypothetical protein